ncbi:hypothetical protein Tco_0098968 [Tanacetum coccineum]
MLSPMLDSFYHTEQKTALGYHNDFLARKQAQQKQQGLSNGKVILEKHDPPAVYDSKETLQLAQESHLKIKQLNKEIKLANYAKINKLSKVFVSQNSKSRKELYFSNTSKMASVPKSISIPNEEFLNDTSLKADESLAKHKDLEFEIERLLKAVVNQDTYSIVQSNSVDDTSISKLSLIVRKKNLKLALLKRKRIRCSLDNWYKKYEECKYDKISYDKAYNDMQQKIERFQAQLENSRGELFGNSGNSQCVLNDFSDTLIDFYQMVLWIFMAIPQRPTNRCFSRSYKAVKVRVEIILDAPTSIKLLVGDLRDSIIESNCVNWKETMGRFYMISTCSCKSFDDSIRKIVISDSTLTVVSCFERFGNETALCSCETLSRRFFLNYTDSQAVFTRLRGNVLLVHDESRFKDLMSIHKITHDEAHLSKSSAFSDFPENSLEVLNLMENSVEVLKILENKLESMKIIENKLESLKLQENQPVDGFIPPSTKKIYIRKCFREAVKE